MLTVDFRCVFRLKMFLCKSFALFHPGLIVVYYTILSSCVQKSKASCTAIPSTYQHCRFHPAGVRDLDCFQERKNGPTNCMWKPGNNTSEKTYMLIIRQSRRSSELCKKHESLTEASQIIKLYEDSNITAEVFENSGSRNCTKTVFRGLTRCLLRCGPPLNVSFSHHSGKLDVVVTWPPKDPEIMKFYYVRYKALGDPLWNKLPVQCHKAKRCTVENLNSSLVYFVQIQCVIIEECSQSAWSETYIVPSELTATPEIDRFDINDIAGKNGKRLLFLSWKFSTKEQHDSYSVTIAKASGELPRELINTTQPEIRLILSYSDYHLSIRAVNNASTSPAVSKIIPQREKTPSIGDGRLNVTVHNNTSFTVYWKDDLIKKYVCYCVEWRKKGHKAIHMSFYQNTHNYWTLSHLPEPLEPYKRYTITLHKRPNKETCNMKRINDSESTYGSTQFYFAEGTPVSAPTNVSSYNVSVNSVVLEWSSLLEEDIRGFLLGYTIHYMEYPGGTERNITVDPVSKSYKVGDLKSGTAYQVKISGFTQAGTGVRGTPCLFKTNNEGYFDVNLSSIIPVFAVVITLLIFGPSIIKRTKVIVWPNIPNPGSSNAMQKIERTCELELLESINTLKVEEWDTNSLQIVEKEAVIAANTFPHLHDSDDEGDSPEMTCNWIQRDTEDATEGVLRDDTTDTIANMPRTNLQSFPLAFSSEYTTMEMFNQVIPQGNPANTEVTQAEESEPENTDLIVGKLELDYIGQFSTSPNSESEMSTIL